MGGAEGRTRGVQGNTPLEGDHSKEASPPQAVGGLPFRFSVM